MRQLVVFGLFLLLVSAALAQEAPAAFQKHCASCHGMDGKADTTAGKKMNIPPFSSDAVQEHSDDELYDHIANGTGHRGYPHAFAKKGMAPGDIRNIVAFIRSFRKAKTVR